VTGRILRGLAVLALASLPFEAVALSWPGTSPSVRRAYFRLVFRSATQWITPCSRHSFMNCTV
jgi:hypothetical protein